MKGPLEVVQVRTETDIDLLKRETRRRPLLPEHLAADPPPIRQYMALDRGRPAAWAASIAAGRRAWCSNVYVAPRWRRKGVARSILSRLLRDDRDAGCAQSVLLASHAGARFYPSVGYEAIGGLMMFIPRK